MTRKNFMDRNGVQRVIARIDASEDVREIIAVLAEFVGRFGFLTVGLGHTVNPQISGAQREKLFQFSNWKQEWTDVWLKRNVIIRDPIARYALGQAEPFRWRDAFEDDRTMDREIEGLMREFGFHDGLCIPVRADGRPPGAVTLGADRFDTCPEDLGDLHLVCVHAYSRIDVLRGGAFNYQPAVRLTLREREILHYVAGGRTNPEISKILGISSNSVRDHIQAMSEKLGAFGRAHVVAAALRLGLILP